MNPTRGPFARTAHQLHRNGWQPIPLTGDKIPAVRGRTGHHRRPWTRHELDQAVAHFATHAVGIVMPDHIIGLDVDHYNHKTGAHTIARMIDTFGDLPATWHLRAERRPAPSARFLYRVPPGTYTERTLRHAGGHVELIQPHHRHAVSAGTVHHTAGVVRWYDQWCRPVDELHPPHVDDIPPLPDAWVQALAAPVARPGRPRRAAVTA